MARPLAWLDVFTATPMTGNALAVVHEADDLDESTMHAFARETNLSETAFVAPPHDDGSREVRWFTPAVEVSLCGHATLAVGHVLVNELGDAAPVRLESATGPIEVSVEDHLLSIRLAADPPSIALPPSGLLRALGCHEAVPVLKARQVWVVRLSWAKEVEALAPHLN